MTNAPRSRRQTVDRELGPMHGGRYVAPVVTASLKVGGDAMDGAAAPCSASDEIGDSTR
jgi:hypothetical protein